MKADAKKIHAAALVEGEKTIQYIICDLDESRGCPIAMLFWPSRFDGKVAFQKLDPARLSPAFEKDFDFFYTGNPIPISNILTVLVSKPTPRVKSRLGFFFLPVSVDANLAPTAV